MANNILYFLSPQHTRSVIAEAWAEKANLEDWKIASSGWANPRRDPLSIKAMQEVNIDLTEKPVKKVNEALLDEASYIIAIYDFNNDPEPPLSPGHQQKVLKWHIPDPDKTSQTNIEKWAKYQEICDRIAENVKALEEDLNTATTP
ncbi:MAG TPA: low molecular weight phosphatase family protein [Bacillaceae bacterium]